jgi:TatA/E family protein of Tat protein translocase
VGLHAWELIPILVLAVLFLGPKRLPDAGKSLGRAIRGFREETQGLRDELSPIKDEVTSLHAEVTGVRDTVKSSVTEAVKGPSTAEAVKGNGSVEAVPVKLV